MKPNVQQYWVYMMTNRWKNVLYTGITNSLENRIWQHKNGAVPGFTEMASFKGTELNVTFEHTGQRSAFLASF